MSERSASEAGARGPKQPGAPSGYSDRQSADPNGAALLAPAAQLEQALAELAVERAARVEAERVNALRDEFLGMVSHELRTPLNAMVGWLHVLASGAAANPAIGQRATAGLERAVHQQRELVDTLLETPRALRGDVALVAERVELQAVLAAAVQAREVATPALRVDLRRTPDGPAAPVPAHVLADPKRLRQALDELLAHAAKFADLGALQVWIGAGEAGRVAVSFGFDDPAAGTAWDPFADDAPDASVRRRRGGGIGLVLCRRLIELSGGTLRLQAGEPVRLRLELPAAEAPLPDARPGQAPCSQHAGQSVLQALDVLIVDDQSEMREVLSTVLAQGGARVHVAASAAEGAQRYTELVANGHLDLGVLDIAMPVEDGIGLVRRIREQERLRGWAHRPMIALTAHAGGPMREQALAAGFDVFLAKPLLPDDLYDAIAHLLGRTG